MYLHGIIIITTTIITTIMITIITTITIISTFIKHKDPLQSSKQKVTNK